MFAVDAQYTCITVPVYCLSLLRLARPIHCRHWLSEPFASVLTITYLNDYNRLRLNGAAPFLCTRVTDNLRLLLGMTMTLKRPIYLPAWFKWLNRPD